MSGIYIPNVGLPQDRGFELWLCIEKDGSYIYNISGKWHEGKQKAIPVPTHGNLKDADAIRKDWLENYRYALTRSILDSFDDAPIIIPASKEKTIAELLP